jgi:hypothetical protein
VEKEKPIVPGKIIKNYQLRVYMNGREIGLTQADAAYVAEFSERTAQRIEAGEHQPKRGQKRERTKPDPLKGIWEDELEPMLQQQPRLKPMTLFEYLQQKYPGKYANVLRTLQRRVADWRVLHGASPEVMFELRHEPGGMGFSDFTELKGIEITINGKPFEHLIYHYRLGYSGWQYAQIIQGGESFVALSEGLQNALSACGGVPKQHRTDSLSAAYRNSGGKGQAVTQLYDQLCQHYRMQPTRNNRGIAHENGSIESPHGHLKNRIEQALFLRGSFDFASVGEYQSVINSAIDGLNVQCQIKFEQEKPFLQVLPKYRVADYEVVSAKVSSRSTIEVRSILYSVPSRLIGRTLELHLYHDRIVGYWNHQVVVELPRVRSIDPTKRRARCINYRHVIEGLRRKPRAFLYCTWQQELLPNEHYRALWAQLKAQFDPDSAALLMVEALYIAATQDKEARVANYLEAQLSAQTLTLMRLQQHFQLLSPTPVPTLQVTQHDLSTYDQLLPTHSSNQDESSPRQPLPEPQPAPQAVAPLPYAAPLGITRTTSDAGGVVLRPVLAATLRIGGAPSLANLAQTRPLRSPTPQRQNPLQL